MKKRIVLSLIVIFLIASGYSLLLPGHYDVLEFKERPNTKYWTLSTGSKIGYTIVGSNAVKKEDPIIFLHGGPGGTISNKVIEMLSPLSKNGHDLYFYDQIGSGHSDRLGNVNDYSVTRHIRDLDEIITTITSGQVILIGHSWGGMLAVNYLQEHSSKIDKIVLVNPGPILPIGHNRSSIKTPDSLNLLQPKFSNKEGNEKAYNLRSKLVLKLAYILGVKLGSDIEMDRFFTYLNTELSKSTECDGTNTPKYRGGSGYYSHIMTVKSFKGIIDKKKKLETIKTPVLVIKGQCDNQPWGYTKEYLDLLPHSKLEIIYNTGHDWSLQNQSKSLNLIDHFLK